MKFVYVGSSGHTYTIEVNLNDSAAPLIVSNEIDTVHAVSTMAEAKRFICSVERSLYANCEYPGIEESIMTHIEMFMIEETATTSDVYLEYVGMDGTLYTISKVAGEYRVDEYHDYMYDTTSSSVWCVSLDDAKEYIRIVETRNQMRLIKRAAKANNDPYNDKTILSKEQIAEHINANMLKKSYR